LDGRDRRILRRVWRGVEARIGRAARAEVSLMRFDVEGECRLALAAWLRHALPGSSALVASESGHSSNGSVNMINKRHPSVFAVVVVVAALTVPAHAADVQAREVPAVATPGNVAEAEAMLGAKVLICSTCHGENGIPRNTGTPIIWGQQENYLVKQMHDFQHGERESDVMHWMATALSQAELGQAAAYFAKKSWPVRPGGDAAASPPSGVAVCEACHQPKLAGGLAAPRLAGQRYEYLTEAMHRYAEGGRTNNSDMMRIMEAIPSSEREAIARYISSL
jgi:cytochrome c553